jgi:hypothetical protein
MQIIYFPYLHLGKIDQINFGDITIWNFELKASHNITDEKLRKYIRSVVHSNISHNQPIKDIGILSIGTTDFRVFDNRELEIAKEIRLMLFLSFISKHNTRERGANAGWYLGASENFEFVIQNFQPYTEHIAEQSGYIVPITTGGYKIGEHKFFKPSHVLEPIKFSLDGLLIKNLLRLKKRGGKKLYTRILQATDLFFESYYNNPNVSRNARVLLQIASFETLLMLPQSGQRKDFKDKVEKYCDLPKEKLYKHYYETHGGKHPERRSRKVIWADTYYTLRNHIIHGNTVKNDDFIFMKVQRHIDIAILFFVLLIKKLINEKSLRKKIFFDEIVWTKTNDDFDKYEGFIYSNNEIYRLFSRRLKIDA